MSTNKMADTGSHMSSSTQKPVSRLKYTTFVGSVNAAAGKTEDALSLQEAFKRYRKARQKDIRKARRLRKRWELRQGDPDKMMALRRKFVAQAKKYIGVPYAKKYWPPDSPEYSSKLFLDCCGLVRQVMRDLVEDFGFYIGPWNQAYMYDTLPVTIQDEKDMKPGDLVFISATYYNTKSKKQRHNMTHVEIWAGDGPKTIGSRWNNGKVQIWDNYKFTAKSYYDETYHLKSIDTWLMGICESHCRQHLWKKPVYNFSKKSIFSLQQDNSQDETAGDDDDNVSDDINAKCQPLPVVCIQQNVPEVKKTYDKDSKAREGLGKPLIDTDDDNDSDDINVKGQPLPVVCIQQNIPEVKNTSDESRKAREGLGKPLIDTKVEGQNIPKVKKTSDEERKTREGLGKPLIDTKVEGQNIPEVKKTNDEYSKVRERPRPSLTFLSSGLGTPLIDTKVEGPEVKATGTIETQVENPSDAIVFTVKESKQEDESLDDVENLGTFASFPLNPDEILENQDVMGRITAEQSLPIEMSELYIVKPNENFTSNIPKELLSSDVLPKINVKVDTVDGSLNTLDTGASDGNDTKTKIAWVTLGTCPVCLTDLNSLDSPKPCHTNDASESASLVLQEIESGTNTSTTCSLTEAEANETQEAAAKNECLQRQAGDVKSICDNGLVEMNLSNNALPKRTSDFDRRSQTGTPEYDKSLPCDECHDVQPSESSLIQQRDTEEDQSEDASCGNRRGSQSRSESSGVIDQDNPSEPTDDSQSSESAGKKSRGKKSPGGVKKETKLPACSLPSNMQPTFFVGGGNGVSLVEGPLTNLGWKRTTDKYDERFKLKWVECKSKINYGAFKEGEQMVNHLPNSHLLTNKLGLLNSLKEYERVTLSTKGRLPRLKMSEFHPETYKLDEKGDRDLFLEVYKDGEIWICKPIGWNQGKGIFLIRSRESINQILEEREQKKLQPQKPGKPLTTRIVQRYIMNPLLLDGKKFDVRAYMLVASTTPFLILYHKGYVRLSCHKYDQNDMSMSTHLTNQFIQKKDPAYKDLKEETAWSMDKFNDYINEEIRPNSHVEFEEDWVYNTFTKQMQKIMIHCFNSVKHKLQCRVGFFDLFGLDFMVDTDMRVWLIEVNTNPALHCNCEALKEVIPGVVEESLYVAIECFEKSKKNLPLMPLQSLKHFTILYCGTRPNTIIPRQSRSVSPVKDNTSTASEKQKPASTGVTSRPSHRLLTQSTPLVAASNSRKSLDKTDSHFVTAQNHRTESNYSAKTSSSTASAKVTLPAIATKADDSGVKHERRVGKLDNRTARSEHKLAKSDIIVAKTSNQDNAHAITKPGNLENKEVIGNKNKDKERKAVLEPKLTETTSTAVDAKITDKEIITDNKVDENISDDKQVLIDDSKELEKRLKESDIEKSESASNDDERRSSVVDTLTRTQNSLNLATSALGKINISLNQVGLTDTLLEEVRLKMTHADPAMGVTKPNSAKLPRGRENLDRGN